MNEQEDETDSSAPPSLPCVFVVPAAAAPATAAPREASGSELASSASALAAAEAAAVAAAAASVEAAATVSALAGGVRGCGVGGCSGGGGGGDGPWLLGIGTWRGGGSYLMHCPVEPDRPTDRTEIERQAGLYGDTHSRGLLLLVSGWLRRRRQAIHYKSETILLWK